MSDISEIRAYWTKPDPPVLCSACQQPVAPPMNMTMAGCIGTGMPPSAPACPHCGERAGWTFVLTTGGRDAKADILTLLAALSASGAGVEESAAIRLLREVYQTHRSPDHYEYEAEPCDWCRAVAPILAASATTKTETKIKGRA